ncbi:MAG: serine/threonine-protein kinase, partial [Planctomycetota bacterium]
HRDIKPGNLMLDQSGVVWLMDFGLAKLVEEEDLTRDGELIGTLRYMAPEQVAGRPTASSDVYSLGLTLYELLTLRPAFDELSRSALLRAVANREPVAPRRINAHIPRDLETIVLKSMEREPG